MLLHRPKSRLFSTAAHRRLSPSADPPSHYSALLQSCNDPSHIRLLHQQILTRGLLSPAPSPSLGLAIAAAYLASSALAAAAAVLERLSPSPIQWWNLLIRKNLQHGLIDKAFHLLLRLRRAATMPDGHTLPFILKACGELPSFRRGTIGHAIVCLTGLDCNAFVSNSLITMYSRCGSLEDACKVFDEMTTRGIDDLISWNSIVASHVKVGSHLSAIKLFAEMSRSSVSRRDDGNGSNKRRSDAISLVSILPACAALKDLSLARQVHGHAMRNELHDDVFIANAIIDAYAKCGSMIDSLKVFRRMGIRDVVSWNTMVGGYSQNGKLEEAFELFKEMRDRKIDLNVVTWTAVIAGYAQHGRSHEALEVFRQMQLTGANPNSVTVISLLSACASIRALSQGMEIHAHALRRYLLTTNDAQEEEKEEEEEDLMVQNSLIDMYSKCKNFSAAQSIFRFIPPSKRNVVTWTVLIGGYAQHGDANLALELFSTMLEDGSTSPNAYTLSCTLMACARLSALRSGCAVHAYALRNRHEIDMMFVSNCLIDMYSKCGHIESARRVFGEMPRRNSVSWTSLMMGYGMHGRGEDALSVFEKMRSSGMAPDGITFLVLLYAFSHSGMVDRGLEYFGIMSRDHGVVAGSEHYACIIDLLGRCGRLREAWEKIDEMPTKPTSVIWVALLGACRTHSNVELGVHAFEKLMELGYVNDGTCTILSNIYANAGLWQDVARIRRLMRNSGIKKRPGCSWIHGKKGTAAFYVGDKSHPESQEVYALLGNLIERIKALGYTPKTCFALHDVDDEEKGYLLLEHSEKLALAYGILTSSPGAAIRITKNMRVCGDCHSAITFISMIVDHEILLRDSSRFHIFKNGSCSCRGFW
ncbi:Pentatricopeptide repeat-containing protein [Platanthera guangdongensis]|uniref:Pentatricopeptide repeat-containing protein n=1 Tax=Platanthera guangdongensis TaxID=2320717 RepID=A0ABR2LC00_9ASPA